MKISKRLKAVGDLVEPNSNIIDVGCDHALLDIYLINKHINVEVIASDIAEGPLKQARKNIETYHMENVIDVRLGNGIEKIDAKTDTVVISGMGGKTMIGIFKNQKDKLEQIKTILVSPNNDIPLVRSYLVKNGFYIEQEAMVEDHNIIYQILEFKRGTITYNSEELYFGPLLLKEKSELFYKYFKKDLTRKEITLELLPKKYFFKRRALKKEIKLLKKTIN